MNVRLQRFLEAENISQSQFAESIGVARAGISHIIAGRNKPGFDFIERMARKYPALSIEWLVTGRGRMYKQNPENDAPQPEYCGIIDSQSLEEVRNSPAVKAEPRDIERIVIFYRDGSFDEFKK